MSEAWLIGTLAFALAAGLTAWIRRVAIRLQMIDRPNERSSHVTPTPRGGGLAIVVTTIAAVLWLVAEARLDPRLGGVLVAGGGLVAGVGFLDDRYGLSPGVRLVAHVTAAVMASWTVGGLPAIPWAAQLVDPGFTGLLVATVGLVWALNLFNFMDGIDGIAGSEAAFVGVTGSILSLCFGGSDGIALVAMVLGGASIGFLWWNWPPAGIFMGDAGSGFLGFVIGLLALTAAAADGWAVLLSWLVLCGSFLVDATVTLAVRLARGQKPHLAHRTHTYQKLSIRWQSHSRVTLAYAFVNVAWLLPWAGMCRLRHDLAPVFAVAALSPLVVVAIVVRAGIPDESRIALS